MPKGGGSSQGPGAPKTLPSWIEESDIDFYGEEFKRSGFRGALNYYRNIDRSWEITGAMAGLQVTVPALYIAGDRDFVVAFPGTDQLLTNMKSFVPGVRKIQMLPGCGHWTQQERPNEVSAALSNSLKPRRAAHDNADIPRILVARKSSGESQTDGDARRPGAADAPETRVADRRGAGRATLVGVAETYFVSFLGTEALAGVSLVFPIFMLMQMMSNGGIGGGVHPRSRARWGQAKRPKPRRSH